MQGNKLGVGRAALVIATAALLAACTACSGPASQGPDSGGSGAKSLGTVRFLSASDLSGVAYTPLTGVPVEEGYWKKLGVNVTFNQLTGGASAFQALAAGQADMIFSGTSTWFPFLAQGSDVESVCNVITKFINTPMVPDDSPVTSIEDFKGKKIGVASLESSQIPLITAMLESVGLTKNDVTFVAIDPGPAAIQAYKQGAIDVFGYFDTQQAQMNALLKQQGSGLRAVQIPSKFSDLAYEGALYVSPSFLKEHKDAVTAVLKGIAEGYVFTKANPSAAVQRQWQLYPQSKPLTGSESANLATAVSLVQARLANSVPIDGKYCYTPTENVVNEMNVQLSAGVLKQPVDAAKYVNNDLVDQINSFDEQAIIKAAKAAK